MQLLEPQQFASWDDPIEMLYACHSKVKRFCKQLALLPEYLAHNGVNQVVKNDVRQILIYFNQAAPLHHEDEEQDFFPALAKLQPQTQENIDKLEQQHYQLHYNWDLLAVQLEQLLLGEREQVDQTLIDNFIAGYDVHIALEEPLFELGKQHLSSQELKAMGKVMSERRKVSS